MCQELGFSGYKAEHDIIIGSNTRRENTKNKQTKTKNKKHTPIHSWENGSKKAS